MEKTIHIFRMIIGFVLYWAVSMAMPARWWSCRSGWLFFLLPHIGYYAYHPIDEIKWYEPETEKPTDIGGI